jgi:hypothetical protein
MHATIYDKHPTIDHRTIGGEGFIITPGSSQIHSLNPVATFIFDLFDGQTTLADVVSKVVSEFEVEPEQAEADVLAFVLLLEQRGMLHKVGRT